MPAQEQIMETKCLSSLSKIFADGELNDLQFTKGSALLNESYSFQVAFRTNRLLKSIGVKVISDLESLISVKSVGLVPSELPCYHDHDDQILRSSPGLYPDPLYPIDPAEGVTGLPEQWRAIWIEVDLNNQANPGNHTIQVIFESNSGEELGKETFELEVIQAMLPPQKLIHTEWFHSDCLATYYDIDVFSEAYWERIDQYVQTAVKHGINMILTPLFTPPLDTEIGGERPTVQLIEVEKSGQTYHFSFDRLKKWVDLCSDRGIQYFEFSHLFTQWGAKHAPKVMCAEQGQIHKIFGWETDASGQEYSDFLAQFLPRLIEFIESHNLKKRSYFHVSDEPRPEHSESYRTASEMIREYVDDYPVIDALSDYSFYEKGLVKNPIPASNHIGPFLEHGVENLWTYYCCSQYKDVSNRFFNLPSARNRIIGMQLYKFNIAGFLHWGYNFWYAQYSKKPIDPFQVTDANCAFPSGDAFLVYPGEEGPIESIRLKVFYEALQDLRAFQLLENSIGKEQVIELLEEGLDEELTFSQYPLIEGWLLSRRALINEKIKELYN